MYKMYTFLKSSCFSFIILFFIFCVEFYDDSARILEVFFILLKTINKKQAHANFFYGFIDLIPP